LVEKIIRWYKKNQRDLPWRKTNSPYKIWVSEIILQQTRIQTGIRYYHKFIKKFPNINSLALAEEVDVLKVWQGLGYYNRVLNMLYSAKIIVKQHNSNFPTKYDALIKLKGIGPYTAAAISSICKNEQRAVLDGNVYRLISRLYNIKTAINTNKGRREFQSIANNLLPTKNTGLYNQAIMDFGSIQCKKYNPKCSICPLRKECHAAILEIVNERPIKILSRKLKIRYFNYLFIKKNQQFLVQQRGENDIWKKLYELPLIESEEKLNREKIMAHQYFKPFKISNIKNKYTIEHNLSHQKLNISFWDVDAKNINTKKGFEKITLDNVSNYPFSKPLEKYFQTQHLIT